jgi:hypothetical protein
MAWTNRQKSLVHIYKAAADLPDQDYRAILHEVGGCDSAAHPALTQYHFEHIMARIETILDYRVAEGIVPSPNPKYISNLRTWRTRIPQGRGANSRLTHKLRTLWCELAQHLPEDDRTDTYLAAIASRACHCRVRDPRWDIQAWQASLVIEALKDRLRHALANTQVVEEAVAQATQEDAQ